MKALIPILCIFFLVALSSFTKNNECAYAGSNIDYIKSQTQLALDAKDLNISKFHTYKALSAIEKSKNKFKACGCDQANKSISKSMENLKKATRTNTLASSRISLDTSMYHIKASFKAINEHEFHTKSNSSSNILAINTVISEKEIIAHKALKGKLLYKKIDSLLVKFENSLAKTIATVDCKKAKSFAKRIYTLSQKELLKDDLTEGKKYYYLKTKEIISKALEKADECIK